MSNYKIIVKHIQEVWASYFFFFGSLGVFIAAIHYGDCIDVFNYILSSGLILLLIIKFTKPPLNRNILIILLWITNNIVFLDSLNRVDGYPDKEMTKGFAIFIYFVLHVWIFCLLIIYKKKYLKLIIATLVIIHCSGIFLVPGSIIRQYFGCKLTKPSHETLNFNELYFTKITTERIFSISMYLSNKNNDEEISYATLVYNNEKKNYYVFEDFKMLLDGWGSMDAQIPNQSYFYKEISKFFLKRFRGK